ncbi:glycosyltransferase [Enterobacter roggenkampii]|uniref:glycosyltransferase n=1 Tax=Enterobacter roggenkampii TaxID=1812935 RepID=UPI0007355B9A|nr:glycosyltransferase [Enterobacter roggenkampii]KTJ29078.1 hypothetical protein ASU87_20305 [Enterobacter roggenkampii]
MRKIDIVIPIYRGMDETVAAIETVHSSIDKDLVNVILINDCSPEPELTEYLRITAKNYGFILLENESNLGFTGTTNRGMTYHNDTDVIFLNSDVEVVNDWVERLRKIAHSNDKIATVTPYSNNATICSFPNFCEDNVLFAGMSVDLIDKTFSSVANSSSKANYVEVPTGVGFCMYLKREAIEDVGLLDVETFGRGYGEENDWCQRAIKKGWKNVHALDTFVYHKGGVSFADEQNPRKERAMELLNELHPQYTHDVMRFIEQDPAHYSRIQTYLSLLTKSQLPTILLVSHKLGGGVKKHIAEMAKFYKGNVHFLLLTPGATDGDVNIRIDLSSHSNKYEFSFGVEDYQKLLDFLKRVGISLVHFHHTLGFNERILKLPNKLQVKYAITIHDYFLLSSNPTLTDENGLFIGDNVVVENYNNKQKSFLLQSNSYQEWLNKADEVIFPSIDCYSRFIQFMPQLKKRSRVAYHLDHELYAKNKINNIKKCNQSDKLKVLVIGALSKEKGADNLEKVAKALRKKNIEFYLLGYAYRQLDSSVIIHGPYNEEHAIEFVNNISPDVVWYPALWPETYSYTLSLAIQNGYPVIVPNIGAFTERVTANHLAKVIDWDSSVEQLVSMFEEFMLQQPDFYDCKVSNVFKHVAHEVSENYYSEMYLSLLSNKNIMEYDKRDNALQLSEILINHSILHKNTEKTASIKERILLLLWMSMRIKLLARLVKFIPINIQKKLKRYLSRKPMHEIINKK